MANINSNLFKPWVKKSIKTSLIQGMNGLWPEEIDEVYSVYNKNAPAKIRPQVVSAFCKIANIAAHKEEGSYGAFGQFVYDSEIGYCLEIMEGGTRQVAVVKNNKIYACKKNAAIESYVFKEGYDNGVLLLSAIILVESMKTQRDSEFSGSFKSAFSLFKSGINEQNIREFGGFMAVLSENLYRRLCGTKNVISCSPLNEVGNVMKLTEMMLNSGKYVPASENRYGKFAVLDSDVKSEPVQPEVSFSISREWTENEKQLIPSLDPWYVMPPEVLEICSLITKSTGTYKPKRNFMLRGPSSTGKTSMARAIAAVLKMPYVYLTCSADTESSAFLGEPMYDAEGKVRYVESDFIRAIKNGWVVEVQEPYVIAKQGVLTALNGLLDDGAGVTLATGEFVKRHPDSVVIFTTNVSYVGCKKPNQSVLRRMNNVYDVVMPSEKDICDRVVANTKFSNIPLLRKMIGCVMTINNHLQEEMIDDGVCGISEIIDWVSTLQITKDIVEAAKSTIVSKATDDTIEQANVLSIVESMFGAVSYDDLDLEKTAYAQ